ncbi:MAG: exosortase/archaeosortase family protein, partial [Gemmatimonadota bacterium]
AWWSDPDAGHGLLLAPLAILLAWRTGIRSAAEPQPILGASILLAAVLLRYVSGLAAELFTLRASLVGAVGAILIYRYGLRQLLHWWLPTALLVLSIPIPDVIINTIALPLQLQASEIGAALLEWRHVPVLLTGNIIRIPGHELFVTEACSGLRSLTSLLALGLLVGGLWLRSPWLRALLVAATIPVAILLNGFRVFLTAFLVYFVDPGLGDGFMHLTEGWMIFVVAFLLLGAVAWGLQRLDRRMRSGPSPLEELL